MSARSRASIGGACRRACPERREAPSALAGSGASACAWQSIGLPLGVRRFKRRNTCAAWRRLKPNKPPKPLHFPSVSFHFFLRIEPSIARWRPLQCSHISDRRADPFPSLLGKVARSVGWGVARRYDARRLARTLPRTCGPSALLSTPHPSPSAPPSPLRGAGGARRPPAGLMTCVNAVVAPRRVGRVRDAPLQPYGAGSAGAEHPPPSRFPGRPRRDPRGLTARECCQCVQRRAPQFSLRSVGSSLQAATATRDRSADTFAIIARDSIFVEKLFSVCSHRRRPV